MTIKDFFFWLFSVAVVLAYTLGITGIIFGSWWVTWTDKFNQNGIAFFGGIVVAGLYFLFSVRTSKSLFIWLKSVLGFKFASES